MSVDVLFVAVTFGNACKLPAAVCLSRLCCSSSRARSCSFTSSAFSFLQGSSSNIATRREVSTTAQVKQGGAASGPVTSLHPELKGLSRRPEPTWEQASKHASTHASTHASKQLSQSASLCSSQTRSAGLPGWPRPPPPDLLDHGRWYPLPVLLVKVDLAVVVQPQVEHAGLLAALVAVLRTLGALLELGAQG